MNSYWRLSLAQHFLCLSHPAKNCFPISISLNLNTIWRSNSYRIHFPISIKGSMFPKWGPKILGWKRNNFISIHQTSPTTKRQQIQIIATADFLIFCFHSMSFISNSKQVFERKNINKNESNRLWICKFWSKSKRWALGIPRIQVSLTQFDKISVNFYLDPYNLWGFIF